MQPKKPLSPRETEALRLVIDGLTADEMAERMGVSPRSTKAFTDSLRVKFDVEKKRHLVPVGREYLKLLDR